MGLEPLPLELEQPGTSNGVQYYPIPICGFTDSSPRAPAPPLQPHSSSSTPRRRFNPAPRVKPRSLHAQKSQNNSYPPSSGSSTRSGVLTPLHSPPPTQRATRYPRHIQPTARERPTPAFLHAALYPPIPSHSGLATPRHSYNSTLTRRLSRASSFAPLPPRPSSHLQDKPRTSPSCASSSLLLPCWPLMWNPSRAY